MTARVCNLKLEFVGGPNDGEVHVLRGRRFVLGPAPSADVRYEAERMLQGAGRVVFEVDAQAQLGLTVILDTGTGEARTAKRVVSEGDVLQVGATEILVAEIAFGKGSGGGAGGRGEGPIECGNPKCRAPNEADRMWCTECGRDL
jgi:hypothetical protein